MRIFRKEIIEMMNNVPRNVFLNLVAYKFQTPISPLKGLKKIVSSSCPRHNNFLYTKF